jgi:hypothetical protein
MAKSIVTYCDVCLTDDDTYTEGRTIPVPAPTERSKPRTIDLCDVHEKQYVTPFIELVARLGVTDTQAAPIASPSSARTTRPSARQLAASRNASGPRKPIDETCPVCGVTYKRAQGEGHFGTYHKGMNRARELKRAAMIDEVFECDQRDCGDAFVSLQGLKMHKLRTHGIKHSDQ